MMKLGLAMAAAAAALLPQAAQAAPFINGSFETYNGAAGATPVRQVLSGGDTAVTGWTNSLGFQLYESDNQDGIAAQSGSHYVSFGHGGATGGILSQTFDTVLGASYLVNYFIRDQQGSSGGQSFNVSIAGGPSINSGMAGAEAWSAGQALAFVGTGEAMTLRFTDATTNSNLANLALDNITLSVAAPVPEPATWSLMLLGFGALGYAMRRRPATSGCSSQSHLYAVGT